MFAKVALALISAAVAFMVIKRIQDRPQEVRARGRKRETPHRKVEKLHRDPQTGVYRPADDD